MLTTWEDVVLVIVTVVCSLLFKMAINRFWTTEKRRTHNDLIGWQLSILGTTYAVIVGFMLYTVWTNFRAGRSECGCRGECSGECVPFSGRACPTCSATS